MKITKEGVQDLLETLEELREEHLKDRKGDYPYNEWEKKREVVRNRLRTLPEYVRKAVEEIRIEKDSRGRPQTIDLEKKVMLFLFARLMRKSNRGMEEALELFQPLFGFDVSYKYIERLYSDEEVRIALHNLFILLLREEEVSGNFSGDGTGYSVTVETHYRKNPIKKGKYLYFFSLIDLGTGMYVGYGFSNISEMDAFLKAMKMLKELGMEINKVRLDRYYSSRKILRLLGKKIIAYLIPKKNLRHIGLTWYKTLRRIIEAPLEYLTEYYLRNTSESGFSSDKRRFGSLITQKREDRQETALFTIALLHNLYAFKTQPH